MSMICEICGKRERMPVFNGKEQVDIILVNLNDLMTCQLCITRIEKRDKKKGNNQQTNLF